eukprot:scaffold28116_cov110-Isochrysis_galbana.AAC.1
MPGSGAPDMEALGGAATGAMGSGIASDPPRPTGSGSAQAGPAVSTSGGSLAKTGDESGTEAATATATGTSAARPRPAGFPLDALDVQVGQLGGQRRRQVGRGQDAKEGGGRVDAEHVEVGGAGGARQVGRRAGEQLLAQVRDAGVHEGVIHVARERLVQPRLQVDQLLALRTRGEIDGEGKCAELQHLLKSIERGGQVQQAQDGLRLDLVQLRHAAHDGVGLAGPELLQQRGRAGRVAAEEEGEEILKQLALQRRLARGARARAAVGEQSGKQELRRGVQRLGEERVRLGIVPDGRQPEQRLRELERQPRLQVGPARPLQSARYLLPSLVAPRYRVGARRHRVRQEAELRAPVDPFPQQRRRRQRLAAAGALVHSDEDRKASRAEVGSDGVLIQRAKDSWPREVRYCLAYAFYEGPDVPGGQRLRVGTAILIKLGVKLEVFARDGGREGAVKRQRVVQRGGG